MKKITILVLMLNTLSAKKTDGVAYPAPTQFFTLWNSTAFIAVTLWEETTSTGVYNFWFEVTRVPAAPAIAVSASGQIAINAIGVTYGTMTIPTATGPLVTYGVKGSVFSFNTSFLRFRVNQSLASPSATFGEIYLQNAWSHGVNPADCIGVGDTLSVPSLTAASNQPTFWWIHSYYAIALSSLSTPNTLVLNSTNYLSKVSNPLVTLDTAQQTYVRMYCTMGGDTTLQYARKPTWIHKCTCGN